MPQAELRPVNHLSVVAALVAVMLLFTTILILGVNFVEYLAAALPAITYPFELDYGEGIVWQQALLIPGPRMYGPIDGYPAIVFHYPPLYHLAVRFVSAFGVDYLQAGRAISITATLAAAGLVGGLVHVCTRNSGRLPAAVGVLIAALIVFSIPQVTFWSRYMRVDMFGLMLVVAGMLLASLSVRRPGLLYAAMLSFVAAVYTKQTYLAAPVACSIVFMLRAPWQMTKVILFGLAIGLMPLAWLSFQTEGGFLRHLIIYNVNRFSLHRAYSVLMLWCIQGWIAAISTCGAVVIFYRITSFANGGRYRRLCTNLVTHDDAPPLTLVLVTFALASLMLVGVGKSGASDNYLLEWAMMAAAVTGILVAFALAGLRRRDPIWSVGTPILTFTLLVQALVMSGGLPAAPPSGKDIQKMERLVDIVRQSPKAVLSDDMVLLLRAGREIPMEPAIFSELVSLGRWSEDPFIKLIHEGYFSLVINEGPSLRRYPARLRAAIRTAFPRTQVVAGHTLFFSDAN